MFGMLIHFKFTAGNFENMENSESIVRRLQQEILKEVDQLKQFTVKFYTDLKKVVKENIPSQENSNISLSQVLKQILEHSSENLCCRKDLTRFRDDILQVINSLQFYHEELQQQGQQKCFVNLEDSNSNPIIKVENPIPEEESGDDDNDEIPNYELPTSSAKTFVDDISNSELSPLSPTNDPGGSGSESDFVPSDNDDDDDADWNLNDWNNRPCKKARTSSEDKKKKLDKDTKRKVENEVEKEVSKSVRKRGRPPTAIKRNPAQLPPKPKSSKSTARVSTSQINTGDDRMSVWKERIIYRVARRLERRNLGLEKPGKTTQDALNEHLLRYDKSSDNLLCGDDDIRVFIDDMDQTLECSDCHYKAKNPPKGSTRNVEVYMQAHINKTHYRCGLGRFICNICGKPMSTQESLTHHRWFHKSEAEKAEAIANGIEPTPNHKNKARVQCATCGKSFARPGGLKLHEETVHNKDRGKIICPKCGKILLDYPYALETHLRMRCTATTTNPQDKNESSSSSKGLTCSFCQKVYKNQQLLNDHRRRMHSGIDGKEPEKTVPCPFCEKLFKSKHHLDKHTDTHNTTRKYVCRKGCGAGFRMKPARVKHERRCVDGKGTPYRKRAVIVAPPSSSSST